MDIGDIRLGDTIDTKFTTIDSTGLPVTLAGTPVIAAYPGNSVTEITAGITLSVDFDARTGLHNVRVVATSGNGYAIATDYTLVLTAGTVAGISVVGYVVGSFSIEKRSALMPATAGRTLVVDAAGLADANAVKVGPTGAGAAQVARDLGTSVLLSAGTGTGQLDFTSGVVKANLVQILAAAITGTAAQLVAAFTKFLNVATPTGTINSLPDAIPDAAGGLPVTGTRLTAIPWNAAWDAEVQSECADALLADSPARPSGAVATDGGNSATSFKTTLSSAVNDFWKDALILLTSGALVGQQKKIGGYNGTTKVVTLVAAESFTATPADDVTFVILNR